MDHRDKRVTIQQVARAVGVSTSTVSVVLNGQHRALGIREATRQAVLDASERLGYRPNRAARSLRRQRTNVLTLLVQDLANPCFVDIAVSARAAAEAHGFELNVVGAGPVEAELRALDRLRDEGSDGVIVATGRHGTRPAAIEILRDLVERSMPVVILLDRSPDARVPAIRVDVEAGAVMAVEHLLRLGHRRIAHLALAGPRPIDVEQTSQGDRYRGYVAALRKGNLEPHPDWIVRGPDTLAGGHAMMRELLARPGPRPTATLVYNDLTAVGALRALADSNLRVPDEMAVIGTDGIDLGRYTTPALTTVDHPRAELGERGVEVLLALLSGESKIEPDRLLAPRLIVRESCGAKGERACLSAI